MIDILKNVPFGRITIVVIHVKEKTEALDRNTNTYNSLVDDCNAFSTVFALKLYFNKV